MIINNIVDIHREYWHPLSIELFVPLVKDEKLARFLWLTEQVTPQSECCHVLFFLHSYYWFCVYLHNFSLLRSMFSQQQASPQFSQPNNSNMYNGNGINLNNASLASNMATSSMGQMAGQMSVTSMASGPSPGLPSMGQEQVNTFRPVQIHWSFKWDNIRKLFYFFKLVRAKMVKLEWFRKYPLVFLILSQSGIIGLGLTELEVFCNILRVSLYSRTL